MTELFLKYLTAFSIVLTFNSISFAQADVDLQPGKITVGDPIELTISVQAPGDAAVIWPSAEDLSPAEVLKIDTLKTGRNERSIRYTLSIFEPGMHDFVDIPIIISFKDNTTDTLIISPGSVEVESVLDPADSTADIRDIHPPVKLAWTLRDMLPIIIVVVAILFLAVAAYIFWRRLKIRRGEIVPSLPPPIPPHIIAMRKLEELRIKRLWQNGYLKEYHSEVTEIVKEYIGGRYEINAPEMTTFDLMDAGEQWVRDNEGFLQVKRILTCGDLVKFARYKPESHENETSLNHAFSYVEATKPEPVEMETGTAKKG